MRLATIDGVDRDRSPRIGNQSNIRVGIHTRRILGTGVDTRKEESERIIVLRTFITIVFF